MMSYYIIKLSRYSCKDLLYCPCSHTARSLGAAAGYSSALKGPVCDWRAVTTLRIHYLIYLEGACAGNLVGTFALVRCNEDISSAGTGPFAVIANGRG